MLDTTFRIQLAADTTAVVWAAGGKVLGSVKVPTDTTNFSAMADALPGLTIVLNHCGGPLSYGSYAENNAEHHAIWRRGLFDVAKRPNVVCKLSAVLNRTAAIDYFHADRPAAERIGLATDWRDVDRQFPSLPLFIAVAPPAPYATMRGEAVVSASTDLRARLVWHGKCHESMAGTGSTCTAAASRIPGSVVDGVIGAAAAAIGSLRIGHPMGVMAVNVQAEPSDAEGSVTFIMLGFCRTARRIVNGTVYVPRDRLVA